MGFLDGLIMMIMMGSAFGSMTFFYLIIAWIGQRRNAIKSMSKKKYFLVLILYILLEAACVSFLIVMPLSGYLS